MSCSNAKAHKCILSLFIARRLLGDCTAVAIKHKLHFQQFTVLIVLYMHVHRFVVFL